MDGTMISTWKTIGYFNDTCERFIRMKLVSMILFYHFKNSDLYFMPDVHFSNVV